MPTPTLSTAATENVDLITQAVGFIQNGGNFMYIILVVFAFGLAIALERTIYLTAIRSKNKKIWNELFPMLSQGKFKQAMEVAKSSDAAIARILVYGLSRSTYARRHDEIELAMEEGLMEVLPALEKRTPYLATLANIATLLGLLGTIFGLISAFTAVASADPAQKADLLSASISVAMNTTAFGLIAAIPLLLIFTYLQSKTSQLVDSMEMASVKFINIFRQAQNKAEANREANSKV
ncbi:MAG: MotA/TolQ/ExbB proton channel family protein [Gammaproteobacteria bacterium]|nr:MotA/TolQ/ExbB proton channel family protein [Gammaproteobacteria bacterium]